MTTPRLTGAGTGELAMARPRAVMAVQDYHPPPAQIVMGAIPVTIGEIGWVFGHPVRGCVYVHMGLGSQVHRKGFVPEDCLAVGNSRADQIPVFKPWRFGSVPGLILPPGSSKVWVAWTDWARGLSLFRSRQKLRWVHGAGLYVDFGHHTAIEVPSRLRKASKLKGGSNVWLVIEINRIGSEHEFMWCRLPAVGPNPELRYLRSMAVRLEWVDGQSGRIKTTYLTPRAIWEEMPRHPGQLEMYRVGMHMYATVGQIVYVGAPQWFPQLEGNMVYHVVHSHLQQAGYLIPTIPQFRTWPVDNTVELNMETLWSMYPEPRIIIGYRPQHFPSDRRNCDICLSFRPSSICDFNPQTGDCRKCRYLNRLCTWTDDSPLPQELRTGGKYEHLGVKTDYTLMAAAKHTFEPTGVVYDLDTGF